MWIIVNFGSVNVGWKRLMWRCERRFNIKVLHNTDTSQVDNVKKKAKEIGTREKKNTHTSSTCIHLCEFYEPISVSNIYRKNRQYSRFISVINQFHHKIHKNKFQLNELIYQMDSFWHIQIYLHILFTQVDCERWCVVNYWLIHLPSKFFVCFFFLF